MTAFDEIAALVASKRDEIDRGKDKGGAVAGAIQRATLAYFDGAKRKAPSIDVAAATLLLLSYGSLESFALAPKWWLEASGPAFALEAMCRTTELGRDGSFNPKDHVWIFEAKDAASHLQPWEAERLVDEWVSNADDAFRVLRAACGNDAASMKIAEHARKAAPAALRCALAYVMDRADWAREEAIAITKKSDEPYYFAYRDWLFASLDDGAVAQAFAKVAPLEGASAEVLQAFADRLGAHAVPALATLLERKREEALAPLLSIRTSEAVTALLPSLAVKARTKQVLAYYKEVPGLAAPALAAAAREKTKLAAAAKSALAAVLEAHPKALDGGARDAVFGAAKATAPAAAIPSVLASPPWLAAAAPKAPAAPAKITPKRVPIRAAWKPGERDEWDAYGNDGHVEYATNRHKSPSWEKLGKEGSTIDFFFMHRAPEEIAVRLWEANEKRRLYYPNKWYGLSILGAVARRGPKFVPGLLAVAKARSAGADRMPIDEIARVLVGFDGTEIAETFLDAYGSGKKFDAAAIAWSDRYVETMALAAIPRAVVGAKPAIALLRDLVARGHAAKIQAVAEEYGAAGALAAHVSTDPLRLFPPKLPKLPSFVRPEALPAIELTSGGALPRDAVTTFCTMLAFSPLDAPYAGVVLVRDACRRDSLRDFALALFDAWLAEGAPPKESWAMTSLGLLGDDEVVRRLVPLVRAWPGEGLSARAVTALGVLEAIGTDLALSSIDGIAQKTKFQSIKLAAAERIAKIAARRNLSPEDLGDRLVPDLGIDAKGGVDLGAYRVVLDEQLEPHVVGMKALPKSAKDENAKLKALKKDLKAVASQRIARLETILATQRAFPPSEWRLLFADHPLVRQLARRLVWRTDAGVTFRIDESGALTDANDAPFTLGASRASLAHPLDMDRKTRDAWGKLFADYELLQPFLQIARETYTLEDDVARVIGKAFSAPKLVFGLDRLGWTRDGAEDGGSFLGHSRTIGDCVAHVGYEGAVAMGYIDEKETLTIRSLDFSSKSPSKHVASEVLRDLFSL